ncbi:hypothetical protein CKM354_000732900 [Cercospora kikuchii]|uniref:DUF7907 domain-containing protein n=1 Tax=Cercospora kikuchii TaxID=84275 RepID=A0A9P3CP93_9PEZI|nr:uncharacterized protein CKM354_000732900 [Cercospora kikuchii]GIZ44120.1 hypothetical protein CKM354_000732900 [Cercospora kikuchii]
MLSSTILSSLLTVLATTSSVTAQALSSSTSFVLWPIITAGELEGRVTNWDIDRRQPLATASGSQTGGYTTDCFNRYVFTSYVGTHCYGSDQCGYRRWSVNATNPDPDCNTLVTLNAYLASMLISGPNEVDELGRRNVGWSNRNCGSETGTPGFSIDNGGEKGIFHVRYDNPADQNDEFGTFFTCWTDGELYGPRLFYRNAARTTPKGCAELLLVPRCADDTYAEAPLTSQCYQGGLPA